MSPIAPAASTNDDFHMPDGAPEPRVRAQDDEVIVAPLSIVSFLEEFARSAV